MARCRLVLACFNFFGHVLACLRMLSVTHNFHTHHLSHTTLSHTHTISLCHTPSFTYHFVTHNSSHTTCFTSRSSITFTPRPPTTCVDHYWKELTCGVIRSFNFKFQISCCGWAHDLLSRRWPLKNTEIQMYWAHGIHSASETMLVMALIHWFIDQLGRCSSASARTHVGLGR